MIEINDKHEILLTKFENNNQTIFKSLNVVTSQVSQHDKLLIRLSNGTSNADVLDKLEETKSQIRTDLVNTNKEISDQLYNTNLNITNQIMMSNKELNTTKTIVKYQVRKYS